MLEKNAGIGRVASIGESAMRLAGTYTITFMGCLLLCSPLIADTIYVDATAKGSCNGTSWDNACASLSDAIARSSAGDDIWVAQGTYDPIQLKTGVRIYGGFGATETSALAADPETHKTYIGGRGVSRAVVSIENGPSTLLSGFYIVNGNAPEVPETGGGAYLRNSSPTFRRCVFVNNTAWFAGGAVANHEDGSPKFLNCRFISNGGSDGGPLPVGGGAVFNHGGASVPTFINCLFHGNIASAGGAVLGMRTPTHLVNCTFSGNRALHGTAGALFDRGGAAVRNCIFRGNVAVNRERENEISWCARTEVSYSNVQGNWPGEGNIDADPLFVNPAVGDFRLQGNSSCRDAGRTTDLPQEGASLDLGLNTRVVGTSVDMGAFEYQSP